VAAGVISLIGGFGGPHPLKVFDFDQESNLRRLGDLSDDGEQKNHDITLIAQERGPLLRGTQHGQIADHIASILLTDDL
jgi:hypothetical protein